MTNQARCSPVFIIHPERRRATAPSWTRAASLVAKNPLVGGAGAGSRAPCHRLAPPPNLRAPRVLRRKAICPMVILVLGLVIFLGLHSTRIFAEVGRAKAIARLGEGPWKGVYSLLSLVGFVLIVWGFGRARGEAAELWAPPEWARHTTILLMLLSMILIGAYIFKRSQIAVAVHHPMVWGVAIFAAAHLLRQRLERGSALVRRVPHLGGRRPRQLLCPRPAQRDRLSDAQLGRDHQRDRSRRRVVGRAPMGAASLAVRGFADGDVTASGSCVTRSLWPRWPIGAGLASALLPAARHDASRLGGGQHR